nr:ABC transporter permease [Xylocopilactobacillus apis]
MNQLQYFDYLIQHLQISFMSLLITVVIGVPFGVFCAKHQLLAESLIIMSQLLRIIPSLAVLFILIPFLGTGIVPALIALVALGLPSVFINTVLGFKEVPPIMIEVGTGMGMSSSQLWKKVEFPFALPFILNGVKISLVEIIASTTLAAYIGAGGLGTLIFTGLGLYRTDLLLIGGGSVAILSLISMTIFDWVIKHYV